MPHVARGRYNSYILINPESYYEFRRIAADGDQVLNRAIHDVIDNNPRLLDLSELCYNKFTMMSQSNHILSQFDVPKYRAKFFEGWPLLNESNKEGIVADVVEAHFSIMEKNYGLDKVVEIYNKNLLRVVHNITVTRKMKQDAKTS